jgi:alpha-N-arabinofuranosidase
MASYAPLFAHIDAWQWTPNLIWTDNLRVFGTPNYYVQQLYCRNRGDVVLPIKCSPDSETGSGSKLYASAVRDKDEIILKLVNPAAERHEIAIQLEGADSVKPGATAVVLAGKNLADENSLDAPTNISPRTVTMKVTSPRFNQAVPAYSMMVLRVPL